MADEVFAIGWDKGPPASAGRRHEAGADVVQFSDQAPDAIQSVQVEGRQVRGKLAGQVLQNMPAALI
jgi:hypothetical protein